MRMSLKREDLAAYIVSQLNTFFPDRKRVQTTDLELHLDDILERTEHCFSKLDNKYYIRGGEILFDHLNADHYAIFLAFAANRLFKSGADPEFVSKIFHLNRYLHGIDIFYEIEIPDIFLLIHPLGTVLGRGVYSNYLVVYQRCLVGSNNGKSPAIGEHVTLHPGSSVIGDCRIGEHAVLASGALLVDMNLEPRSVYMGNPMNHVIRKVQTKSGFWKD